MFDPRGHVTITRPCSVTHLIQLVRLLQKLDKLVPGEVEEVADLGLRPVEVLDAEGVHGDLPDPDLPAPLQSLRQLLKTRSVSRDDLLARLEQYNVKNRSNDWFQ